MSEQPQADKSREAGADRSFQVAPPQLSLPKGGGAIRGIGEKFSANPVNGTGTLTVPVFSSPGRSGFGPQLALEYNSGAGNSSFGLGWSLNLPTITRKSEKGLPQYNDTNESDIFILAGAEDLVPVLVPSKTAAGEWDRDVISPRTVYGKQYAIHRYRPRLEGLFSRIERWTNLSDSQDTFWRSISKDNVTAWYGKTPESRIVDPADPSRVFSWLICETYDDKGNVASYSYKAEDSAGIDHTQANERNRTDAVRGAQRYIKHIFYGNRTPYFPDLTAGGAVPLPSDWCFQLVFDYGEHDISNPVPQDTGTPWACRTDPFSSYRSTFEVRTYRLCRRVLMFHHFKDEANLGLNCLVRSTDLDHALPPSTDASKPFYSYLLAVAQTGYVRTSPTSYLSASLPQLEFEYIEPEIDDTVRDIDPETLENVPVGVDGSAYRWADLDGEGLSGILTEQSRSWFYKSNLTPINVLSENGREVTFPRFSAEQLVASRPSLSALRGGHQQLMDLSGDGKLDLVDFESGTPGFFERTDSFDWEPFRSFASLPVLDWRNPNLKFVDLTGDGLPDLLISEDDIFWWHASESSQGFGPAQRVAQSFDEEKGPRLVFADGTETIFLADCSGDGLTDLVRVRNGEVCYWPNLGYGRFGSKVTMDQSPLFDRPEQFHPARVQLTDIDGSGTADLIYFSGTEVRLYFNQSGNAWGAPRTLKNFPHIENVSKAHTVDLLGNGTACLVWSSPLAGNARRQMRYINLLEEKPHLLRTITNNLGAETRLQYSPSTRFYVADKLAGTPWLTRLPFPVHVVERVEVYDYVSRNRLVTRYSYHHGYFDGVEREFRGFGRVEQWDTEELDVLSSSGSFPQPSNQDPSANVPPTWTKTWFHTGAFFGDATISRHFEEEYYSEGDASDLVPGLSQAQLEAMLLDDTVFPGTILLSDGSRTAYDPSGEEMREACRALRGSILRQEIYALDSSDESDRPYSVSERNYTIEALQPQGVNQFAVFFAHPRETVEFQYERKLFKVVGTTLADPPPPNATDAADPRVKHSLTLAVDAFGNTLQSVSAAYGRRFLDPGLTPGDQERQTKLFGTYTEGLYTNAVLAPDAYRTPMISQSSSYELLQFTPASTQAGITNLFGFEETEARIAQANDGNHDVPFENLSPTTLTAGEVYRRILECTRTYYRPDDLGAAAGDPKTLLALQILEPLALAGASYKLAFTPGLISQVYKRKGSQLLPAPAAVLGSTAADGGGYVDLDGDGHWWMPSGRVYYLPAAGTAPMESAEAVQNFFLPRRFEDPFGNSSTVDYDKPHDLLPIKVTDPLPGALTNITAALNDYRVLQPRLLTDPNNTNTEMRYDALGLPAATAIHQGTLGDSFATFTTDLSRSQIDAFYDANDPHTLAGPLLGTATTRIVYDVNRFQLSRAAAPNDPSKWLPIFAATLARETHVSDLAGKSSNIQISFSYSDGFAREIQKKVQAEPGPVVDKGPVIDPRWVASGWTIFNNKGNPVRKYEPFFSQLPSKGHQFEYGVAAGVGLILCYDPLDRVVVTIHPNHTYDKVVFDPWHQANWDQNDTVLVADPAADSDVGGHFERLPLADYTPTWYSQRSAGGLGPQELDAANKAAAHAGTPTIQYFDTLGRTFLTILDNGGGTLLPARVELDIQGNTRILRDAVVQAGDQQGRIVMTYDYDLLKQQIHEASMEAGERWILKDATSRSVRAWDNRGHNFRMEYDALRRSTSLFVLGTDNALSDPRTTAAEVLYDQTTYGEAQPAPLNLRTRIFQHGDAAGILTNRGTNPVTKQDEGFDFKGNLLRSSRGFFSDYSALPDLTAPPATPDVFASSTVYDALNRPILLVTPDLSVLAPSYNKANLIDGVKVNVRGAATANTFIADIGYNARGQRILIDFGNANTRTDYTYDLLTFRLTNITTTRPGAPANQQTVQDLTYTYDPVGNVTHIQDDADIQNAVFFRNQRVEPSGDFTYDAIYRLIRASGREQLGLGGGGALPPSPTSYNDVPRIQLPHPGDGNAMGTYVEQYQYDAAGNFLKFIHQGANPANPGWTRSYAYNETSLLEPGKTSNRLSSSAVSGSMLLNEPYGYDAHGNMTGMPQLQSMQWNFANQLLMTQRQAVNANDQDGKQHQGERTYYVYDAGGQRARKATQSAAGTRIKERFYLGGFELYREYDNTGAVTLARETLHVNDEKKRIAIVETKTVDASAPPGSLPSTTTRYQFDNHLGTASLELDETGAVITYEEYYPFGSTSYQAGRTLAEVSLKRYRYTGKERDEETGFNYHGARYCAPWLARWVSCDPVGTVDGTNLYAYVNGNPIRSRDAKGTDGDDDQGHSINLSSNPNARGTFLLTRPQLKLDPANFWYSSISQGTGRLPENALDVELGASGVAAGTGGLGRRGGSLFGLQSAQLGIRKAIGDTGFDLGVAGSANYTDSTFGGGSGGGSALITGHYGFRASDQPGWLSFLNKLHLDDLRPGAGIYVQAGGVYQGSDKSVSPTVIVTGVAALEKKDDDPPTSINLNDKPENPYKPSLSAVVLNPNFSYAGEGQLTQGPNLRNLITAGGTLGVQVAFGDQFSLLPELNILYETGQPLAPSDQSASALRITAGIVATYSWLGYGTEAQSNSIAVGAWYFNESGAVRGTSTTANPTGPFTTSGVLFGIVFGYRSPAVHQPIGTSF